MHMKERKEAEENTYSSLTQLRNVQTAQYKEMCLYSLVVH